MYMILHKTRGTFEQIIPCCMIWQKEKKELSFNPFLPADQNNAFANDVDPDETAHNEPSHQDLHCLLPCFDF